MNTPYELHLVRLCRQGKTFSKLARELGMNPRTLRKGRNEKMPRPTANLICAKGKLLCLQLTIRDLVKKGKLAPSDLNESYRNSLG